MTAPLRAALKVVAAALIAVAPAAVVTAHPAAADTPAPAPGLQSGDPAVTLLAQSPFVESGQDLHLQLQLTVPSPSTRVEVALGSRLTTRSGFDADVRYGARSSSGEYSGAPASSLPADASGGVDVDIPVNPTSSSTLSPFTVEQDTSGVYPVTVELLGSSLQQIGTPLTTFMVYASPSAVSALAPGAASNGLPRLDVALSVPVRASPEVGPSGQPAKLSASSSAALAAEAGVLAAHPGVGVTLDASPATLDSLEAGTAADRATLAQLGTAAAGGDQVAEEPYASVSFPGLTGAGLGSEGATQLAAGDQALATDLGHPATAGTLVVNGPLDQVTLTDLTSAGINQLVVPSSDLSALPSSDTQTTVASPTDLAVKGPATAKVVNVDAGLAADLSGAASPALGANRLLAELAMIQLETPGEHRGVAVVPPAGWQADPAYLATVLTGLTANPLLNPVTTSGLFSLPLLGGSAPLTRSLTAARPTVPAFSDPVDVRTARQAVDAVGTIFPAHGQSAALGRTLLLAESTELDAAGQRRLLGTVAGSLTHLRRSISLIAGASVTLTARNGDLPITVVATNGTTGAQVQLRLSSEKLTFRPFRPPGGSCTAPGPGVEQCQLALDNEATTLKVPVEARASGVFPLAVSMSSPDGAVALGQTHYTVRSTAFSGVGVVLMAVAGLGLAYWWISNIRHGRRARDLVPPSTGEEAVAEGVVPDVPATGLDDDGPDDDVGPPGDEAGSWLDDDPVIAEFFARPAPSFPPPSKPPRPS